MIAYEQPAGSPSAAPDSLIARRFVMLFVAAPMVLVPAVAVLTGPLTNLPAANAFYFSLFLMSTAHGGLSGVFWLDRRYRRHMAQERQTYYWKIAALTSVCVMAAIALDEQFYHYFAIATAVWLNVHFARQNWGVICLTALATRSGKPSMVELIGHYLACAGGTIAILQPIAPELPMGGLYSLGTVLVGSGFAVSAFIAIKQRSEGTESLRIAITLAMGVFFVPAFLMGPIYGGVAMGLVHAAQYSIIITAVATGKQPGSATIRVAGMLVIAAAYLTLAVVLNASKLWGDWLRPAQVAMTGIIMWHFAVDAGLFRMSQPFQRSAMRESVPFLFAVRAE